MSLTLRGRHYWSRAEYLDYFRLQENGTLTRVDYDQNSSLNFNVFTADMQFVWYFAPGSELSIVWKNYIRTSNAQLDITYFDDFRNTLRSPQANSFSLRVLYYLDYVKVKSVLRKNA
jgi:hypothetical protein